MHNHSQYRLPSCHLIQLSCLACRVKALSHYRLSWRIVKLPLIWRTTSIPRWLLLGSSTGWLRSSAWGRKLLRLASLRMRLQWLYSCSCLGELSYFRLTNQTCLSIGTSFKTNSLLLLLFLKRISVQYFKCLNWTQMSKTTKWSWSALHQAICTFTTLRLSNFLCIDCPGRPLPRPTVRFHQLTSVHPNHGECCWLTTITQCSFTQWTSMNQFYLSVTNLSQLQYTKNQTY